MAMNPKSKRKLTTPGLGDRGRPPKPPNDDDDEEVPSSRQNINCPPSTPSIPVAAESRGPDSRSARDTIRNACPEPLVSEGPSSRTTIRSLPPDDPAEAKPPPPPPSRERGERRATPVRVDEVGGNALKIALRTPRHASTPRLAKSRPDASKAPLDPQSAYVLSLIDGIVTLEGIADIAGIPVDRVASIIERLERLGFVAAH
jgi:hypothetical protein